MTNGRRQAVLAAVLSSIRSRQRSETAVSDVVRVVDARLRRRRILLILACRRSAHTSRRPRRWAVRPTFQARSRHGAWYTLIPNMRANDPEKFFEFMRMSPERFDELRDLVAPHIQRHSLNGNICPGERLALTLRYLASGSDMRSASFTFLISPSTVSLIIRETCLVIWKVLKDVVFPPVLDKEYWRKVAEEFEQQWHFPHCIGAMDGRHCTVQAFPNTGSDWFNYKQTFSMVLLGLVDANYKFIVVDIGGRGRRSDGGLFRRSSFGDKLLNSGLNLPPPKQLPGVGQAVPYVVVADEAFPLTPNLMRPYPGDYLEDEKIIFNYRLSRARHIVENAFGVMCARWRILRRIIIALQQTVKRIIQACTVLHNWLVLKESRLRFSQRQYMPAEFVDVMNQDGSRVDGQWRRDIQEGGLASLRDARVRLGARNYSVDAGEVRELFTDYFVSQGQVHWQWKRLPCRRR